MDVGAADTTANKEQEPKAEKEKEKESNDVTLLQIPEQESKFDCAKFQQEFNPMLNLMKSTLRELKFFKEILDSDPNDKILQKVQRQFQLLRRTAISDFAAVYFPKYYVGFSEQLETRLMSHFENDGSLWTKKYKPISVIEICVGGKELEEQKTLEMMRRYGWQNVRGSYWCQIYMRIPPKNL
jgi:hypothetical protein